MTHKSVSCQTDSIPSFNTDLLQAYHKSGKFCDISIQSTVDDSKEIISCHKVVLATASTFFQQELAKNEYRRNIYIEDIDHETLRSVIEYIYSGGAVSLSNGNVFKLFSAAQHFQLQQLETDCMNFIEGLISVPEVINVLRLAQYHSNDNLTSACIKFIMENLQEVKEYGFFDLDAPSVKLLAEHQIQFGLPTPEDTLQAVIEWLHKDEEGREQYAFYLIKDIPLTKISLATLRKLLREDTYIRSIQTVYNLYVDSVEEIGRELEGKRVNKRSASALDSNPDRSQDLKISGINDEAGASKRHKHEFPIPNSDAAPVGKNESPPALLGSREVEDHETTKWRRRKAKRGRKLQKWATLPPGGESGGYYVPLSVRMPASEEIAGDIGVTSTSTNNLNFRLVAKPMIFFVSQEVMGNVTHNSIMSLDLESKRLETVATIPQGVFDSNCSLLYHSQKVYCFGSGQAGNMLRCNLVAVFNLDTKTWDPNLPNIPMLREDFKPIVARDFLYVIGGMSVCGSFPIGTSNEMEQVNLANIPCTNWARAPRMMFHRTEFGVCYAMGRIFVVGGSTWNPFQNISPIVTSSVECYTTRSQGWKTMDPMPTARRGLAVASHSHFIYAMGGCNGSLECLDTVEIYDTTLNIWLPGIPMMKGRQNFAAGCVDDYIYAIGGDSVDHPTAERLDIRNQVWESMGLLPINGFNQSMSFVTRLDRLPDEGDS